MQGDRVNPEYYLQFADHYFRVLAETRSRFEENRRQNGGAAFEEDEQEYDEDGEPIVREPRAESRQPNGNNQDRGNRAAAPQAEEIRQEPVRQEPVRQEPVRQEAPREDVVAEAPVERPRRGRPPRRAVQEEAPAMFEADLLPPSLNISAVSTEEPAEKPKRRRGRPPASETTTAG